MYHLSSLYFIDDLTNTKQTEPALTKRQFFVNQKVKHDLEFGFFEKQQKISHQIHLFPTQNDVWKFLVVPKFVCHKPTKYFKSKNVTNKNFDLLGSKFQNSYDQACGPTKSEI